MHYIHGNRTNSFRVLDPREIETVAGGVTETIGNPITVIGDVPGYFFAGGGPAETGGIDTHETLGAGDAGGGTNGEHCQLYEKQKDDAARSAAEDIVEMLGGIPGIVNISETREFGAIIYVSANGTLQTFGPMALEPTTDDRGQPVFSDSALVTAFSNAGLSGGSIVGYVHNHPAGIYPDINLNRYPSDTDWRSTSLTNIGADTSRMSLYIIDALGVLREFRYADEVEYFHLSPEDRQSGVDLPSGVEAGNAC